MLTRSRFLAVVHAVCGCLLLATSAQAQDPFKSVVRPTEPLTPAQEQKSFQLPPGFEIQLVAAEPDILKPINMAFDARGRLWVTDSTEYPIPAPPDRKGRDTIKILEDTNGDGRADKITTFADELNIPMGIYPYRDGAIAFSIPNVWHLRDTDGDGHADKREKLYGPMGYERDTHGMNNGFRRGFDGWVYACHGFNNRTTVKGRDGHTIQMNSGNTFRMRIDGSRIEHFTWGQVNPFGMTFDPLGNLFTADCHSKPLYQMLRNGYYPSFGAPHDGLGFVPPMMYHSHGSTAIAGVVFYSGTNFPTEYRANMFTGNVMTCRINRNKLVYHGSTIRAEEQPDLLVSKDPWFRPVDVQLGPDGALYIADFYNKVIGHYEVGLDHPGRDRHRGRIWRIIYTGTDKSSQPAKMPLDLTNATIDELIEALDDRNLTFRTLALNRLVDGVGQPAAKAVGATFGKTKRARLWTQSMWLLHRLNSITMEQLKMSAAHKHRKVRVHTMKVLAETPKWSPAHRDLALAGLSDADAFVQRAAADALGQHPHPENVRVLLDALPKVPSEDTHLALTIRMALRNQFRLDETFARLAREQIRAEEQNTVADLMPAVKSARSAAYLIDYIQNRAVERETLLRYLRYAARYAPTDSTEQLSQFTRRKFAGDSAFQLELIKSIHAGLQQQGQNANQALKTWGVVLAEKLLNTPRGNSLLWSNSPLPGSADKINPWVHQKRPSADGNRVATFFCSFPRGERRTGSYRSEPFSVPARLSFYIAGHVGPTTRPSNGKSFIRLLDSKTGKVLIQTAPPRNDIARRVEWKLDAHTGRQAYVELVDGDSAGGFAWMAVGRFSLGRLNPNLSIEKRIAGAQLVAMLKLGVLYRRVVALLRDPATDTSIRPDLVRALLSLKRDSRIEALVPLIADLSAPASLRQQIVNSVLTRDEKLVEKSLADAMRTAAQTTQLQIAEILASDEPGTQALLKSVESGVASPRLLLRPSVQQRLAALKLDGVEERVKSLTAKLPSENAALNALITQRRAKYPSAKSSGELGAAVFAKHCAACHKVGSKGAMIGPQLDGIGNRGLDRLLEDVIDPNRNVDVAFRVTSIVLKNGKIVSGLQRREAGATLVFVDNKGKEFSVVKADIDERVKSNISLMPANVPDVVSETDFYHLMTYLLSQTGKKETGDERTGSESR